MFKKAKENKKGFTLAELLIVVAIIAVLVAISIPIFSSQLEKSREAVDLANIRAAYAECASAVLTDDSKAGYYQEVSVKQQKDGWDSKPDKIAGTLEIATDPVGSKLGETNKKVLVCVSKNGNLELKVNVPDGYQKIS